MFDTAADVLGLTPEEFFSELHTGKTMEEIAEAQDVEMEDLQEAFSAARDEAMRDAIAQAVEDGEITQDEADWRLEGLEWGYMSGRGFGHGFGRGMRGGPTPFAPGEVAPQSE
jgi:aspartyl/asparaginyl-tRNA synthetase